MPISPKKKKQRTMKPAAFALTLLLLLTTATNSFAQADQPASPQSTVLASGLKQASVVAGMAVATQAASAVADMDENDWNVGVYPIFVWLPIGIDIDVAVPPDDNGVGGGRGEIIDGRFDGAFFGALYGSKGRLRVDVDGLWAAFGGDRPELPFLKIDTEAIYFHATGGVRLAGDLYAIGGVRRLALDYTIQLSDFPEFQRKPGVWDPVVGLAWHTEGGRLLEFHAVFEGGGFGVGADREFAGSVRLDLKPLRHFGITAGYSFLHVELDHEVRNRTFTVKQTLHGPVAGIGFYF
jgi:hypothetical protein